MEKFGNNSNDNTENIETVEEAVNIPKETSKKSKKLGGLGRWGAMAAVSVSTLVGSAKESKAVDGPETGQTTAQVKQESNRQYSPEEIKAYNKFIFERDARELVGAEIIVGDSGTGEKVPDPKTHERWIGIYNYSNEYLGDFHITQDGSNAAKKFADFLKSLAK